MFQVPARPASIRRISQNAPARPASIRSISGKLVSGTSAVALHQEHQRRACFGHRRGQPASGASAGSLRQSSNAVGQHHEHQQETCFKHQPGQPASGASAGSLRQSSSAAGQHHEHQQETYFQHQPGQPASGASARNLFRVPARPASIMSISSKLVSSTSPAGQHQEDQSKRTSTAGQHQEHQWKTCFRHQRGRLASGASAQTLFRQARPASIRSISRELASKQQRGWPAS